MSNKRWTSVSTLSKRSSQINFIKKNISIMLVKSGKYLIVLKREPTIKEKKPLRLQTVINFTLQVKNSSDKIILTKNYR